MSITVASMMVLRSSSTLVPAALAALVCATLPPPDRDGDLGPIGRADSLAERQDHLRAVDLLPGVDRHRAVVEVGVEGRAAASISSPMA